MSSRGGAHLTIKHTLENAIAPVKTTFSWIFFVSRRFAKVDRTGSSAVTTTLATLGICFGVMTLITVISVMNGFQHSFIDVIMEISSYHVRVAHPTDDNRASFEQFCAQEKAIRSFTPFYEAQSLVVGPSGKEAAAMIKAVPSSVYLEDAGFQKQVHFIGGHFDIASPNTIILGSELARRCGARIGSEINLYALSGGSDVDLFSSDRVFTVTGVFHTGYADINASFAFINLDDGKKYFGSDAQLLYGVKLFDEADDAKEIARILAQFPNLKTESWKSYNRAFFGALQVEKNMLMVLVFLIFVVVAINIFNGMRRMVFERREEISVLSAFGGKKRAIQSIFVMQGFLTGVSGAIPGVVLGLFLSVNMETVFLLLSKLTYYASLLATMLVSPENGDYIRENPMFYLYANIPPKIFLNEVVLIALFGICSSLVASLLASRGVLKMTVVEVMRDE
ncbi:MAG: ABC transporter permease [Treponema sp.]|nr:ABC transporter permease [Treponema sp.]